MANEAKISKEVVRLSQFRTRETGVPLKDELGRQLVQEALYETDPESGLVLDEEQAYSSNDVLVSAFGVNDVVIKGKRFDVRAIDEEGRISIASALLKTRYMVSGTLCARLDKNEGGTVVGFLSKTAWETAALASGSDGYVSIKAPISPNFDLASIIDEASDVQPLTAQAGVPSALELAKFLADRQQITVDAQRKLAEGVLSHPDSWTSFKEVVDMWSKGQINAVLKDVSVWSGRVSKIAELASTKFKRMSKQDIEKIVTKLGETYGGQPESPMFRKALINTLTKEELSRLVSGATLKKANEVADAVLNGRSVTDVVKEIARNPVAVQIAGHIKRNRDKMGEFVDATTQEILGAFPQMSLQPVYSTHSGQGSSMEPINEALKMLYAGELAKSAKELDEELSLEI